MNDSQRAAKPAETDGTFPVTIYHNPACGTSRDTLARIRAAGVEPTVVEYLKAGWTRPQLEGLFSAMGVRPREALRERGSPAAELGLLEPGATDDQILDAMVAHPILVNRPIVVTPLGSKLTRPAERVEALLRRPAG
ncbi:MAG: arsC [Caulobacteraceae bacterium]|nr:arsC [Caulobacteraceae bacterium]